MQHANKHKKAGPETNWPFYAGFFFLCAFYILWRLLAAWMPVWLGQPVSAPLQAWLWFSVGGLLWSAGWLVGVLIVQRRTRRAHEDDAPPEYVTASDAKKAARESKKRSCVAWRREVENEILQRSACGDASCTVLKVFCEYCVDSLTEDLRQRGFRVDDDPDQTHYLRILWGDEPEEADAPIPVCTAGPFEEAWDAPDLDADNDLGGAE